MADARKPRRSADSGASDGRPRRGDPLRSGDRANTLGAWRRAARAQLTAAGLASPAADADHVAAHGLGLTRLDLVLEQDRILTPVERRRLSALLHKRLQHFPLQYLLGDVDFAGIRLQVRTGVFIPRPETEGLVERVLAELNHLSRALVVDVGTGTGAIALALAAAHPGFEVWGTDVSNAALRLARRNARELHLGERTRFFDGDLTGPVERLERPAPLAAVVSNPPYVAFRERAVLPVEIREHEPSAALFAREDGVGTIRRLIPKAAELLEPGGLLALEIGETQGDRVRALLSGPGAWTEVRIERDLAGKDRYALARRAGNRRAPWTSS